MDFSSAMFLYISGILTYAFALRIFGIYTKSLFYKLTYINSLSILKFVDNLSMELVSNAPGNEKSMDVVEKAYEHWRLLALFSLKTCMPDSVWQEMGTLEWQQAMKMLETLEKKSKENIR